MSTLPPYSTFRTDNKQMMFPQATSHGNILTFTPPGFNQSLNVKFPDSRLAVCEKCKKNFKTRDMCRVRNAHTTAPWATAFICLTLDDSCTDANGKYIDGPFTVRMVQWQPYCIHEPFDPKTPVCAACKKTNRTRSFCRERHKHRQLPWCTVYVLLSAFETADPSTVVAGASKPVQKEGSVEFTEAAAGVNASVDVDGSDKNKDDAEKKDGVDFTNSEDIQQFAAEKPAPSEVPEQPNGATGDVGDDINQIPESRTFLAKVSCQTTSMHWLELNDYDTAEGGGDLVPPSAAAYAMEPPNPPVQHVDPNQHFYGHIGYAAQQHQNTMKSHQQYFYHMQQRNQHHYSPPHAHWQYGHMPPMHMAPPMVTSPPTDVADQTLVTAGEAAAQQQKRARETNEANGTPPSPHGHPQAQNQHWMMYQQVYGGQTLPAPAGQGHSYYAPGRSEGNQSPAEQYGAESPPDGNGRKNNDDNDTKRQRLA